jgi:hypothetical protein
MVVEQTSGWWPTIRRLLTKLTKGIIQQATTFSPLQHAYVRIKEETKGLKKGAKKTLPGTGASSRFYRYRRHVPEYRHGLHTETDHQNSHYTSNSLHPIAIHQPKEKIL